MSGLIKNLALHVEKLDGDQPGWQAAWHADGNSIGESLRVVDEAYQELLDVSHRWLEIFERSVCEGNARPVNGALSS